MGTTLIFPCCVPDGEFYAEGAKQRAEQVVAALTGGVDLCEPERNRAAGSLHVEDRIEMR